MAVKELYLARPKDNRYQLGNQTFAAFYRWCRQNDIRATDTTFNDLNPIGDPIVLEAFQFWQEADLNLFLLTQDKYERYYPV